MIYMVECAFTDPARETAWNDYYSDEKLANLLALPGFRASQRFRAINHTPAPYLAVHSVRDAAVLDRPDYRTVGGGTFDGWDERVTNWKRNLFAGMEAAPEVSAEECLILLEDPAAAQTIPAMADFVWLDIAGLDRTTERRGLAIIDRETGESLARDRADILGVFAPITDRHVSPHGIDN
ncbi:MAG: sugar ABC transporter [Rhodospirillaceae bacterium]|jgi:hypothetical protein|nr:sugar ABC transporter [Rhodospirillaceae bacterium]MBT5459666.1 sugar ABC transporter [Rhodospirillaceae bacterium]